MDFNENSFTVTEEKQMKRGKKGCKLWVGKSFSNWKSIKSAKLDEIGEIKHLNINYANVRGSNCKWKWALSLTLMQIWKIAFIEWGENMIL